MLIINDVETMSQWTKEQSRNGLTIGLVPTMGAIHRGHLSLVAASQTSCDATVVSIFVNPTQFNQQSDFDTYPRTLHDDIALLEGASVDVLFQPTTQQMYPIDFTTNVHPGKIEEILEGKSRPLHFRAVATIVTKLINIVMPDSTFFGKKDRQQLLVIRKVADDLNLASQIIGIDTMRESDGLAMSSRNVRLSVSERQAAQCVVSAQREIIRLFQSGESSVSSLCRAGLEILASEKLCEVDYLEIVGNQAMEAIVTADNASLVCLAVTIGSTRLIDNMDFNNPV